MFVHNLLKYIRKDIPFKTLGIAEHDGIISQIFRRMTLLYLFMKNNIHIIWKTGGEIFENVVCVLNRRKC